ncbi:MAG TPA: alpha/beta fold hydrolase [Streptosporangiaceae bacterium]|nr:alpha/beta fold hydrolase [Streptosporangiaceae bacterium]
MRRLSLHLFEIWSVKDTSAPVVLHFPYAGGGIHAMRDFALMLPERRHLAVNYPARDARTADPAAGSVQEIATCVAAEFAEAAEGGGFPAGPMLLGHSMGAYVALETAAALAGGGLRRAALVVSSSLPPFTGPGTARPQLTFGGRVITEIDDDELTTSLIAEGGLPDEVRHEKELLDTMLPVLRHDIMLGARYVQRGPAAPVPFPLLAVGGAQDATVPPDVLSGWQRCTSASFAIRVWPGGHFWFRSRPGDLADYVLGELGADTAGATGGRARR